MTCSFPPIYFAFADAWLENCSSFHLIMGRDGPFPFNELQKQLQFHNKKNRGKILHQHNFFVLRFWELC